MHNRFLISCEEIRICKLTHVYPKIQISVRLRMEKIGLHVYTLETRKFPNVFLIEENYRNKE